MFKISQEQLNKVLNLLGEMPAKLSFEVIKELVSLEKLEEKEDEILP